MLYYRVCVCVCTPVSVCVCVCVCVCLFILAFVCEQFFPVFEIFVRFRLRPSSSSQMRQHLFSLLLLLLPFKFQPKHEALAASRPLFL